MKKKIIIVCVSLVAAISFQGCINNEIKMDNFKDLCRASGGKLKSSHICTCGSDDIGWTVCSAGVVCTNEGLSCASTSLIGELCDPQIEDKVCENIDNIGHELVCSNNDVDKDYRWNVVTVGDDEKTKVTCVKMKENMTSSEPQNTSCKIEEGQSVCGDCLNGRYTCVQNADVNRLEYKLAYCVNGEPSTDNIDNACKNKINRINEDGNLLDSTVSTERYIGVRMGCDNNGELDNNYICRDEENNAVSCFDDECGICLDGDIRCRIDGNAKLEYCINGHWEVLDYCESNYCINIESNHKTAKCTECKHEDKKCEDDIIYTCDINGNWTELVNCSINNVSCNSNAPEDGCGDCKTGSVKCENIEIENENDGIKKIIGKKYICKNGTWLEPVDCADNEGSKSCASDTSCGECQIGSQMCKEDMLFSCVNGNWIMKNVCELGCANATDCSECKSGDIQCENNENGGKYLTCIGNFWEEESKPCENNASCLNSYCSGENCTPSSVCGICKNDTVICRIENETAVKSICINGEYQTTKCQSEICNIDGTDCALCKPGTKKCNDDKYSICNSDGNWDDPNTCIYEKEDGINGVNSGDEVSCDENLCGECKNDSVYCKVDESGIGQKSICENGIWGSFIPCENNGVCVSQNSCGECNDGDEKCENNNHMICKNNNWIVKEDCTLGCSANEDNVYCIECNPNDMKCKTNEENIGTITKCNKFGKWDNDSTVECDNNSCLINHCSGCASDDNEIIKKMMCEECSHGNVRCSNEGDGNAKLEACINGKWGFSSYCESGKCQTNKLACEPMPCMHGTMKCEDNVVHECYYGVWNETSNECNESSSCTEDDVLSCTNSWNNEGSRQVCNELGIYIEEPCYDSSNTHITSCKSDKLCGECLSGWYKYTWSNVDNVYYNCKIKNNSQLCVDGVWETIKEDVECKSGCQINGIYIRCEH